MSQTMKAEVLGVDPAPTKETVIFDGTDFSTVFPDKLRRYFEERYSASNGDFLISWDAPISFDPDYRCPKNEHVVGYYRREFDDRTRNWVKDKVSEGRIEDRAVGIGPLGGLPHWVISCAALGLPFGDDFAELARQAGDMGNGLRAIEVHPAVSLAVWWIGGIDADEPFPVYKKGKKAEQLVARETIVEQLPVDDIPTECIESDDHLDAWVAWRMGRDFLRGDATWAADPDAGAYVLPECVSQLGLVE